MIKERSHFITFFMDTRLLNQYLGKCPNCQSDDSFELSGIQESEDGKEYTHTIYRHCDKCHTSEKSVLLESRGGKEGANLFVIAGKNMVRLTHKGEIPSSLCKFCETDAEKIVEVGPDKSEFTFYKCHNCLSMWKVQ